MNFRKIKKVLWIILGLNLVVAVSKIILGIFSGAISIFSDGVHSVFDSAYPLPALIANNYGEMMSIQLYDSALMLAALEAVHIVVHDEPAHNLANGGKLLSDKQ